MPSGSNSTLLTTPVLTPANKSPSITPSKFPAVYSTIAFVLVPQPVIIASTSPSGFGNPGPRQSPSTGLAKFTGTGGQSAGSASAIFAVVFGSVPSALGS